MTTTSLPLPPPSTADRTPRPLPRPRRPPSGSSFGRCAPRPGSSAIGALAVIAFNVGTAYDTYRYWPAAGRGGSGADFVRDGIPLPEAFTANAAMVMMLVPVGAIGALAVIGEYSSGMIRTTFAAVPDRRSVMAAKAVVVTAVTTVFGAVVAVASFGLTQAILRPDAGMSISTRARCASSWRPRCSRRCARSSAWPSARSSGTPRPPSSRRC